MSLFLMKNEEQPTLSHPHDEIRGVWNPRGFPYHTGWRTFHPDETIKKMIDELLQVVDVEENLEIAMSALSLAVFAIGYNRGRNDIDEENGGVGCLKDKRGWTREQHERHRKRVAEKLKRRLHNSRKRWAKTLAEFEVHLLRKWDEEISLSQ